MGKESFIIYSSFYKPISILSDKQLGRLFRAIFSYQLGEVVNVEDDIRMAFEFFKNQFEIDESKYQAKIMRDIENGRKGGNPNFKKGQPNPYSKKDKATITHHNPPLSETTQDKAINDNDYDNDNASTDVDVDEDIARSRAPSPPPSPYSLSLDEEIEALKHSDIWLDNLQTLHHMPKEALLERLDEFRLQCIADGRDNHDGLADAKSHFNYWLRAKVKHEKENTHGNNRQPAETAAARRERVLEANRHARMEEITRLAEKRGKHSGSHG